MEMEDKFHHSIEHGIQGLTNVDSDLNAAYNTAKEDLLFFKDRKIIKAA